MPTLIRIKRKAKGLTAAWVAQKANISPSKLSKIEHGHMRLTVTDLARLAKALNCDPNELIPPIDDGPNPLCNGDREDALTPVATEDG